MTDRQHLASHEQIVRELGARWPQGPMRSLITALALGWSLWQLWIASPLPALFGFGRFDEAQVRAIHLAFAVQLAFVLYPAGPRARGETVPRGDLLLGFAAAASAAWLLIAGPSLAQPGPLALGVGGVGLLLLLEATRRALGPTLTIMASLFLAYSLAGPWLPGLLAHPGVSLDALIRQQWLGTEGVFGIALGVSASFVFLFVLFGALLGQAGAGRYFTALALGLCGEGRGGRARAAVLASAMTGLTSGSSVSNVVSTGPFTIPLLTRAGFSAEKAAAVEVAASANGQLMPPVMGAAAFLMVEFVGLPYVQIIQHAVLPALIAYLALLYLVHLEARRLGRAPTASATRPWLRRLLGFAFGLALPGVLSLLVYYALGGLKSAFGGAASAVLAALVVPTYLGLLALAARQPPSPAEDRALPTAATPASRRLPLAGLYWLLPLIVLLWCLMVERASPGQAAFWGTLTLLGILLTEQPLLGALRGEGSRGRWRTALGDVRDALSAGARQMVGIAIATASAGLILGAVAQTGAGAALAELVQWLSLGNLLLMLVITALLSLLLGLGLPTTANYLVVSTLLAPVIVGLGQQNGLSVPLIAVHLFVFYFGMLADVTPRGRAARAAAAVAGGERWRTGVIAFGYGLRIAVLPFLFLLHTELLLIEVGLWEALRIFAVTTLGLLLFIAASQGYFLVRSRTYERLLLLLIAFTLWHPGFWMDRLHDPYQTLAPERVTEAFGQVAPGSQLQVRVRGADAAAAPREWVVRLPVPEGASGEERLVGLGLLLRSDHGRLAIDSVAAGSPAEQAGLEVGQTIVHARAPTDRWRAEWLWLPALALLALVVVLQRRRRPV